MVRDIGRRCAGLPPTESTAGSVVVVVADLVFDQRVDLGSSSD